MLSSKAQAGPYEDWLVLTADGVRDLLLYLANNLSVAALDQFYVTLMQDGNCQLSPMVTSCIAFCWCFAVACFVNPADFVKRLYLAM